MASSEHHGVFSSLQLLAYLCVFWVMLAGIDGMGIFGLRFNAFLCLFISLCLGYLAACFWASLPHEHGLGESSRLFILRRERLALRTPDGSEVESEALLTGFFLALGNAFALALVVRRSLYHCPTFTIGGLLFCKTGVVQWTRGVWTE